MTGRSPARPRAGARLRALAPAAACIAAAACGPAPGTILLATTSSVDDSGLLDSLLVHYHQTSQYVVRPIVVGSGEALEMGRRGDVDAVLAHAPADEERFMAAGHGSSRVEIMRNDYLIVGPPSDPANAAASPAAAAALAAIARSGSAFISRGDRSGTHRKELALRSAADAGAGAGAGYTEAGLGMAETLRLASERGAYTLTDGATYGVLAPSLRLIPIFADDAALANPYSIIVVAGARNERGAADFAAWLGGPAGQQRVRGYSAGTGMPLFRPSADSGSARTTAGDG